jgi:hypothetical protein
VQISNACYACGVAAMPQWLAGTAKRGAHLQAAVYCRHTYRLSRLVMALQEGGRVPVRPLLARFLGEQEERGLSQRIDGPTGTSPVGKHGGAAVTFTACMPRMLLRNPSDLQMPA